MNTPSDDSLRARLDAAESRLKAALKTKRIVASSITEDAEVPDEKWLERYKLALEAEALARNPWRLPATYVQLIVILLGGLGWLASCSMKDSEIRSKEAALDRAFVEHTEDVNQKQAEAAEARLEAARSRLEVADLDEQRADLEGKLIKARTNFDAVIEKRDDLLQAIDRGHLQEIKIVVNEILPLVQRIGSSLEYADVPVTTTNAQLRERAKSWNDGPDGLKRLSLAGCYFLTDDAMPSIAGFDLVGLNLSGCVLLTDAALRQIPAGRLGYLDLNGCRQITDAGMAHIADMSELHSLFLEDCAELTDGGVGQLDSSPGLSALSLTGCTRLTDTAIKHLAAHENLQRLYLTECVRLTDTSLDTLKTFRKLRVLHLYGCPQLSEAKVKELQAALDGCRVEWLPTRPK